MLALWKFIATAQRDGMARVTAFGAYKKAGGTVSASRFRLLWGLAKRDPFRFRGLA